jgi:hypothetical protein
VSGAGGLANRISFSQCDFGVTLGGGIRLRSVQGVLIDQPGFGNIYTQGTPSHAIGNSMIYVGQYSGAAVSRDVTVIGHVRENSGTITFGSYADIEVDAATVNTVIINPGHTGSGTGLIINLNGSAGAQVISPQPDVTISNPAADTIVTGNGAVTVGTATYKNAAAPVTYKPAAPSATSSATRVMMGLGSTCTYTPTGSGLVLVEIQASPYASTAAVYLLINALYGTGAAPANAAAETGTGIGNGPFTTRPPSTGSTVPSQFAVSAVLSLTPGTAYWFDLSLGTSNVADAANLETITVTLVELR